MSTKSFLGCVVIIAGLVLTGCGGSTGGTPTPSDGASTSSADGAVPQIPKPELDAKKYLQNPCGLLTASQVAALPSQPGKSVSEEMGVVCDLRPADLKDVQYGVGITTENTLASLYRNRANIPVFRPGTIAGFPSVVGNSTTNSVAGGCTAFVGIAQDAAVTVDAGVSDSRSPKYNDPCPYAEKVAETVVNNIKGGK